LKEATWKHRYSARIIRCFELYAHRILEMKLLL